MRIAVFGAGGVGGYFGGRLAQAGEEVIFIARGNHLKAIRDHGLIVESIKGDFIIKPATATGDPRQAGKVDGVLLGVKAWQVEESARLMQPMIHSGTFVVPLQNGVTAPLKLAGILGKEHVLAGLCQISAMIAEPGRIRHVGIEPYIAFGELDNQRSERIKHLLQIFSRAGVKAEIPIDMLLALWEKYLFIAPISGIGAITRAPAHISRSIPGTRQLIESMMGEVVAVARSRHVNLTAEDIQRRMAFIDGLPPSVIASMQRDLLEGRPSELDDLIGALVQMGDEAGIPTTIASMIYYCLLPQEKRARKEITF